jgi:hypothetical protein
MAEQITNGQMSVSAMSARSFTECVNDFETLC